MTERLVIDLAACDGCEKCSLGPAMLALRERATFELVCRRCEHASCVLACPFDALERTADGVIKRHNMRCVSCKSCALACPFGTIYKELLPFYAVDYHAAVGAVVGAVKAAKADRRSAAEGMEQRPDGSLSRLSPLPQCRCNALEFGEVDPGDPEVHIIDEHLAARTRRWVRKEVAA